LPPPADCLFCYLPLSVVLSPLRLIIWRDPAPPPPSAPSSLLEDLNIRQNITLSRLPPQRLIIVRVHRLLPTFDFCHPDGNHFLSFFEEGTFTLNAFTRAYDLLRHCLPCLFFCRHFHPQFPFSSGYSRYPLPFPPSLVSLSKESDHPFPEFPHLSDKAFFLPPC